MEVLIENILVYGFIFLLCGVVIYLYLRSEKRKTQIVEEKILKAKEEGLHEPISLHPVIDLGTCIGSGACIAACPEKDILGLWNGKATLVNATRCVGHGACFHACPVQAISLCIGTEKRGVDLPHIHPTFETNVPGIFIAGELGGMGLIKNSVEQGKQAMANIAKSVAKNNRITEYDVVIIGAGPAGISASLAAKHHDLRAITLEQDTLGGTVYTFPRAKIVMTSPMDLPLHGKVKLVETNKSQLLKLWEEVLGKHQITIRENSKVDAIFQAEGFFKVHTILGDEYPTKAVLLAIGRRGSPRKLNVPGEDTEKVAYRLLEPENIKGKNVIVVGGGDSAIEAALSLMDENKVILTYRGEAFGRIKPRNSEKIKQAMRENLLQVYFNSNLKVIRADDVVLSTQNQGDLTLKNDMVYIFAGGELPTEFLQKAGIEITKRFGYTMLKHERK
ncbi:MAG TPA: NAD(P)-binding domain-containing protein [Saprospiraceae bacterium]|nr:NAD(P)-binding domain-containing protein [Saprospiraceae bacterium]